MLCKAAYVDLNMFNEKYYIQLFHAVKGKQRKKPQQFDENSRNKNNRIEPINTIRLVLLWLKHLFQIR